MNHRMTAIDALTLSTLAKREKSHFDAQIAGIKKARQGGSYGFNENFKCIKNQAFDLDSLKAASDMVEDDIRSIKSAIVEHNATSKISYSDGDKVREVSIFEAFNMLKDAESDLAKAHAEVINNISATVLKDTAQEDIDDLFEDIVPPRDEYQNLLAKIWSLKQGITRVNNTVITVSVCSEYLVDLLK